MAVTVAFLAVLVPAQASADEFTVDATTDAVDANLGNGVCATTAGRCTLRAAIQESNMLPGADTITVPGGTYTNRLAPDGSQPPSLPGTPFFDPALYQDYEGDLDIAGPLTITGAGAAATIVDGGAPALGSAAEQTALDRVLEVHATAGNVTISNLTVRRGWSGDYGGAIMNSSAGKVRFVDVTVRDGVGLNYGGGIYSGGPLDGICPSTCPIGDGRLELVRTDFLNNRTEGKGGAVFSTQSSVAVTGGAADKADFTGNHADEGGALYNGGELTPTGGRARAEVTHATFTENLALADGGAIYNEHEGDLAVADSSFTDNLAWGEGGAVDSGSKTSASLTRATFDGNRAGGNGGAVNTHPERPVTISGATFTDNHAGVDLIDELGEFHEGEGGGGAMFADGTGGFILRGSRFEGNSAGEDGGALALTTGGTAVVEDSEFHDNETKTSGGAILNAGMRVTFSRLVVSGNKAFEEGGGIDNQGSGEFVVEDTLISRNTAFDGGGFSNRPDSLSRIINSTLWDNRAKNTGGGFNHESDADTEIENTTISGNIALIAGGGIYVDADGGLQVLSSTITENTSPSGSGVGKPIESINFPIVPSLGAIFMNTIVAGNRMSADCEGAWASQGGNFDGGRGCYFQGPRDRANVNPQLDAIADNGGPTMTHAPRSDSHAIDGGVTSGINPVDGSTVPCPAHDQRGTARPQNPRCDVGAHEFDGPFGPPDSVPPVTTIAEDNPTQTGEMAKFRFSGTDNQTTADDLTFECRVLNQEVGEPPEPPDPTEPVDPLDPEFWWHGCTSPWPGDLLQLEDGPSVLEVRAIDRAGNVDATPDTHHFVGGEDITPPQTILTGTPPSTTTRNSAVFGFSATDDSTDISLIEYECRVDFGDWEAVECLNPMSFPNLTIGQHTFQVRAIDEGDNIDPSPASYTWTVASPTNCDEANITVGASADAYVDEVAAIENFGIAEQLAVASGEFGGNARVLVRFVLPTGLPADCTLTSARLRLYSEGEPGRTLQAIPIAQAWSEMQVTWLNQPGTTGTAATTGSGSGYREWNVTSQIDAMLAGTLPRHGWLIRDAVEDDVEGAEQDFSSKDTIAEPPEVPKLVLRFAGGSSIPPPPPPSEDLEPNHVECGEVLTESTLVLNDISCALGDGLTIGAPNIVVDLGGHTVDGPDYLLLGEEDNLPTGVRNIGYDNVVIRNGSVREYGNGVALMAGARFNVVEHLTLTRNALAGVELWDADDGRNGNVVRDNILSMNEAGVAILADTENSVVEDNLFDGNIGDAVYVLDSSGNRIEGNEVSGVPIDPNFDSDGGIRLEGSSDNAILENRLTESGDAGVVLSMGSHRNRVEGNVLTATGDAGITVEDSDGNELIDNVSHLSSDAGIVLNAANDGVVLDNDVRFNPTGVDLAGSSGNRIEGNNADGSDGTAIEIGSGSLRNRVVDNDASNTLADGIVVQGGALHPVTGDPLDGNVVEGNRANGNESDGIVADAGHTLTGNAAHHNAGWGIDGAEGTQDEAGVVDGGGNTASGNGELAQCTGVVCAPGSAPPPSAGPDLEAPQTIVSDGPPDGIASTAVTVLRFTGTDNVAPGTALRYECRLDPPPDPVIPPEPPEPPEPGEPPDVEEPLTEHWEECSSPIRIQYLLTGEHRFEVRAIDPSDNVDLTPAVHEWTVSAAPPGPDSTPPQTTLVAQPSDPTTSRAATFRFRASDNSTPGPDLRYECRLDAGAWTSCSNPAAYSALALGDHTFAVRALDIQGNPDPTPATHEWTIEAEPPDVTPPNTRIDAAPDLRTVQTGASFEFSSTEEGSTFECALDTPTFSSCSNPRTYSGLAVGEHTLRVGAIDAAGNPDDTPAAHTWTVAPAPVARNVSCGERLTQSVRLTNDLTNCNGDGLIIGADGITVDLNGRMIDGNGQFAGIRNDGFDWVTITGEAGKLQEFDYGVQLNSGTAHNIVSGITAQLNQNYGIQLANADDGANGNLIRENLVTQNSEAGIALTGGTQNARVLANTIGGNPGAGVYLNGSSGNRVEQNTVSASSEAGVLFESASGNTVVDNLLTGNSGQAVWIALGSHDNRVAGNDMFDNSKGVMIEQSNGTEFVDNEVTEIGDQGVALTAANDSKLLRNDVRGNSGGIDVYQSSRNQLEDNVVSENSGTGIWIGDLSYQNVVKDNVANANDSSGIMVEVEAPGGSGTLIDGNTANANDSSGISINKVGHTLVDNTANNNMAWGIYSSVATSLGMNVDAGGNRAVGNKELLQCFEVRCDGSAPIRETFPPDTLIDEGPPDTTATDAATFRFSGSDNALMEVEFECRLDGGAFEACVSPRTYDGLGEGAHTFQVRAVDRAGNVDPTPATYTWTYEPLPPGVPPDTTVDAGPDSVTVNTAATFSLGSNEPGVSFECSLDGAAFAACDSPKQYTGLAVGDHTFRARAVDAEDLVDASPATHAWRIGPPPVPAAVSCGQVLTQSVRLTNSLVDCPADGLVIGAHDITVDLNGQSLDGVGAGAGVRNPRFDAVTITNGSVQEFEVGVEVDPSARNVVSALNVTLNALAGIQLAGARDAAVRTNTLGGNEGEAIALVGGTQATLVRDNTITGNFGRGIWVEGASGNRIEENSITASEDAAIALDGASGNTLLRNNLSANVGGIEVLALSHGTRLQRNTVTSGEGGILVSESNAAQLLENQVQQTTDVAITLATSNNAVVRRNDLRFNGGGIELGDSSGARIESNNASGTTGTGIAIDGASLSNVVALNTASSNGSEGIAVDSTAPPGQGTLIDRNSAFSNGDDGIIVAGSGHTIVANVAHINGEWGLYVEPGNVDGGDNVAAGNVEPQQCFGIACTDGGFVPPGLPDTQLLDRPANPSHSRRASFTFVGTDDTTALIDLEFQCRLDSTDELDWEDCENPQEYANLASGQHVFEVRAMDAAEAVDPTPERYTWTVQPLPPGVAPDTSVVFGPPAQTPLLDAIFQFSSNEPDVSFACRMDDGPWSACANDPEMISTGFYFYEHEFEDNQVGPHRFQVRATDLEGNVDPTPAVHEWRITGVITSIFAGPAFEPGDPGEEPSGGETESTTATFDFGASVAEATYECSLDLGPFTPCEPPVTYTGLAVGDHIFRVIATDPEGEFVEAEPVEYEWTVIPPVDVGAPDTTITGTPANGSSDTTFAFTGTDDQTAPSQLTFECRLDSTSELDWYECLSPHNLLDEIAAEELLPGSHRFEVRAVDDADPEGNPDPTPARYDWMTVADTTPPETTIVSTAPTTAVEFVGTDNATPELLLEFQCSIDGAAYVPCDSPHDVDGMDPGDHTLRVRAVDLAQNPDPSPATYTWTVIGPPETTIDSPRPALGDTVATFEFSADQPNSTFECSLDGSSMEPCTSPVVTDVAGGGAHVFEVQATNEHLIVDETPAVLEWVSDLPPDSTPPDTTIPTGPDPVTLSPDAAFTFSSSQFGSSYECSLDGAGFGDCDNPFELTVAPGEHVLEVRAVDPAGNADPTPDSHTWTYDGPPVVDILDGPQEEHESTSATFTFVSSDSGSTFECFLDGAIEPCDSPKQWTGLSVGEHVFAVRAIDPGGQVSVEWEEWEFAVIPVAPPQTTLGGGPAGETSSRSATFSFASGEADSTFECSLDGAPFGDCDSPLELTGLATGDHTFAVRAVDAFGNVDPTPAEHAWTILDASQLESSITFAPPARTIETEAAFSFVANAGDATFECSLDGAAFEPCASPAEYGGLAFGEHTFAVRAVSQAGGVEGTPATRTWTVVGPPVTTFQSAPAAQTAERDARFEFAADQLDVTYLCSLDGAEPAPCSSPVVITDIGGGDHTFEVEATNSHLLVEDPPALHQWTVDGPPEATPPDTEIVVAPPAHTSSLDATFEFTGTDNVTPALDLEFECAIDGGAFAGCSSPHELQDLAPGGHTLAVRAVDAAGNADPTPATHAWTVEDVIAPETSIDSGPDSETTETSATFELSADEPATFECSLDGAAFAPCTSPHAVAGLALGDHTLDVRARDAAGNADPTPDRYDWLVVEPPDTTPPDTIILAGPPAETTATTATVNFTSDELAEGFECSLDGAPFSGCESPHELEALELGEHTLEVRAIDLADNVDPTPASHTWTVVAPPPPPETTIDSGPPLFAFSSDLAGATFECSLDGAGWAPCASPFVATGLDEGPHRFEVRAKGSSGVVDPTPAVHEWTVGLPPETSIVVHPPAATADRTATFEFTGIDDYTPMPDIDFECSLDGAGYQSCSSPRELQDLAVGEHTFSVRAKDWTNTVDPTPAEFTWTIAQPPDTWIDSGPESETDSAEATFVFASNDGAATFECALDQEPELATFEPCASPATYTGLELGPHQLLVRARSADGIVDPSPAAHEWEIGILTAPLTTISAGPAPATASATASFTFAADQEGVTFLCSLDGAPPTFCTSPKAYADLAPGEHTFEVHATRPHLLVGPEAAVWEWTVLDATDPQTTILTGPPASTTATDAEFTFSSDEPEAEFECSLDGAAFTGCSSPADFSGLTPGAHELRVRAVDAAGNADETPAARSWTVLDATPPDTDITTQPANPTSSTSASFAFTSSEAGSTFQCSLDGAAFAACTSPRAYSALAAGSHTFRVRAVDAAGNPDPTPDSHTWTIDSVPPQTTIGSGPAATTTGTSASFTFTASEPGSTFACSLDGAAFAACTSPREYTGLAAGSHQFRVIASDATGNPDATPAVHAWTISSGCTGSTATVGANIDSWILQDSPNQNYGTDSGLKVDTKSNANARALFRFNLPTVPAGCRVTNAKLRLYATSYKTGRTLQALRLGASWTEGGVKWSTQPATTGAAVTTASGSGYREWAVTTHVQDMYAGANNGWLIRDATENGSGLDQVFHSREKGSDNPPRLVITFAP